MSWRIASNTTRNCESYFLSSASNFRAKSACEARIWRIRTNARMISMLTWTARLLRRTLESITLLGEGNRTSSQAHLGGWIGSHNL